MGMHQCWLLSITLSYAPAGPHPALLASRSRAKPAYSKYMPARLNQGESSFMAALLLPYSSSNMAATRCVTAMPPVPHLVNRADPELDVLHAIRHKHAGTLRHEGVEHNTIHLRHAQTCQQTAAAALLHHHRLQPEVGAARLRGRTNIAQIV